MLTPAKAFGVSTDDLVDILIQAIDPALVPARPLILCLIGGKSVDDCLYDELGGLEGDAKQAAIKQLPFDPNDNRIQELVKVFNLVNSNDWAGVITHAGTVAGKTIACAIQPPGVKIIGCPVASYVIDNQVKLLNSLYDKLKKPDWPGVAVALYNAFGLDTVCNLIPGDKLGGSGELLEAGCSVIAKVLELANQFAKEAAKLLAQGADVVENVLFGDDSHMPYQTYYHIYWEPWYHRGSSLAIMQNWPALAKLIDDIRDPCIDYFDSHNQYRDTAKKTCGNLASQFDKQVGQFAEYMKSAAETHVDTLWPLTRTMAVEDFGKDQVQPKQFFIKNCEVALAKQFPFPEPDYGRCEIIKTPVVYEKQLTLLGKPLPVKLKTNVSDIKFYQAVVDQIYQACVDTNAKLMPAPTAWNDACKLSSGRFATSFNEQKNELIPRVSALLSAGCHQKSPSVGAHGVELVCTNYPVYQSCLNVFQHGAEKQHCQLDKTAADKNLRNFLVSVLGNKRCMVAGQNVECGRPWKIDTCKSLRAQMLGTVASESQVQCKGNTLALADFTTRSQKAKQIVATLNGQGDKTVRAAGGKLSPATPAGVARCKQRWDSLSISCGVAAIKAHPEIKLDKCPDEDPGRNGADDVCLFQGPSKSAADAGLTKGGMSSSGQPVIPTPEPQPSGNTVGQGDQQPVPGAVPGSGGMPGPQGSLPEIKSTVSTCDFDLTFLAPQPPVLETSASGLSKGDQVRITCQYAMQTRHVTRASCDDHARRTAQLLRTPGATTGRVLSAIVAVDGQTIGVGSIAKGSQNYQKSAIWQFKQTGSHTIACQIDNPMGSQVRGADQYIAEAVSVDVAAPSKTAATGFNPLNARTLPARQLPPPAVLLPELRGKALPGSAAGNGSALRNATKTTQGARASGLFSVETGPDEDEVPMTMPIGPGAETQLPDESSPGGGGVTPVQQITPGAGAGGQFSTKESIPEDEVNPKGAVQQH